MYLSRRRRADREAQERAAQAQRAARSLSLAAGSNLRRGPSNTPPRVPLMAQKQTQEVSNDRHGKA